MTVSSTLLGLNTLRALLFGLFLGAAYDVVRIVRVMFGASSYGSRDPFKRIYEKGIIKNIFKGIGKGWFSYFFVFVTDLVYFTFAGAAFSVFLFWFNFGKFRWFIFLSALLGFLAYYFTVGKLIIGFSEEISRLLMLVLNLTVFLVCLPLRLVFFLSRKLYQKVFYPFANKIRKSIDIKHKKRYTIKYTDKLSEIIKFKV